MVRTLELAIAKASQLPEAEQELIGREMLERMEALAGLRADVQAGIDGLEAGRGKPLDVEDVIRHGHKRLAER